MTATLATAIWMLAVGLGIGVSIGHAMGRRRRKPKPPRPPYRLFAECEQLDRGIKDLNDRMLKVSYRQAVYRGGMTVGPRDNLARPPGPVFNPSNRTD